MIVVSAKMSDKHQEALVEKFPEKQFIFRDSVEEAMDYAEHAEIYVTYGDWADVEEKFVKSAPNLKWIAVLSAGVNAFPLDWLEQKCVIVTNVSGIHKTPMSEYVIAMLLQVYRQTKQHIANEAIGNWDDGIRMKEISGNTMLILGTGNIGQEIARLAKAFNMETIGVSRSGKQREYFDEVYQVGELNQLLPKADFLISVLPSTTETVNLINRQSFQKMKSSAVLMNIGRGDLIVEDDLLNAIRQKKIAHAVLDVFVEEPLPQSHPFWKEENITITPHNSGLSPEYMGRALEIFRENLATYQEGNKEMINIVDYKKGY